MKFSSVLIFALGVFVASCSAKCSCDAADQACLANCVTSANACIVKCENTGGDSCQQACISSNWPSMPVAKDILADATSAATATPTGVLTASPSSGASSMMGSASEYVSTYSTTLSGGSATLVTSTIRASGSTFPRSSSMPSPKMGNDNSNSSAASARQVFSALSVAGIMATAAWIF